MEYSVEHRFSHDVDKVFRLFFDLERIRQKNEALGCRDLSIEKCELIGTKGEIKLSRMMSASGEIPRPLRKFHKEWNQVTQIENWEILNDGAKRCHYRVIIDGVPARIEGHMFLSPTARGSSNKVSIKVSSKVPLIGKTIADFICADSALQIENEYQAILRQLKSE